MSIYFIFRKLILFDSRIGVAKHVVLNTSGLPVAEAYYNVTQVPPVGDWRFLRLTNVPFSVTIRKTADLPQMMANCA